MYSILLIISFPLIITGQQIMQTLGLYMANSKVNIPKSDASCYVISSWQYGFGSVMNFFWWASALIAQKYPTSRIYYNHSPSFYQCLENSSISPFFHPDESFFPLFSAPINNCINLGISDAVDITRMFLLSEFANKETDSNRAGIYEAPLMNEMLEKSLIQAKCQIVNRFWRLDSSIAEAVELFRVALFNQTVIAIHARGGDKYNELFGQVDEHKYYRISNGMVNLISKFPNAENATCIIFSDDQNLGMHALALSQQYLKCNISISRFPQDSINGHNQDNFNAQPLSTRCNATKSLIVDIELMAFSTYFIGNPLSNLDNTVMGVRQCLYLQEENTAFDGSGRRKFGIWV